MKKAWVVMPLFITGLTFGTVEKPPCSHPQDSLQFTVMSHPQTTKKAIQLIERFEGVEEDAYLDQVGVATIGAGMTKYPDGSFVRLGDHCSKQVCRGYLESMIENEYIPALAAIPGWTRLGPARQAVLISFAWNLGKNFYGRDGFETISNVLGDGAYDPGVYKQMPGALSLYVTANGKVLEGLKRRRNEEGELWMSEDDGVTAFTCVTSTFLKKAAIPSIYLSNNGRQGFEANEFIEVVAVDEVPEDPHAWVTLKDSGERWAIYLPHWQEQNAKSSLDVWEKVDWDDFSSHVSKHLTVGQILQYDARRKPEVGSKEEEELFNLAGQFDLIVDAWQGPLGVVSGYRPEPMNTRVGGVPGSYHTKGMALDIYPIGESIGYFYQWISRRWSGGLGDGRTRGFVHIDTRGDGEFHPKADAKPCCLWSYE